MVQLQHHTTKCCSGLMVDMTLYSSRSPKVTCFHAALDQSSMNILCWATSSIWHVQMCAPHGVTWRT
eukprot:11835523-Prorocentrum_lima.AAC.1